MILIWIEPKQAETKTILATALAMAPTPIAAVLGENRHDLVGEINHRLVNEVLDPQYFLGTGCRSGCGRHLDRHLAVGQGRH